MVNLWSYMTFWTSGTTNPSSVTPYWVIFFFFVSNKTFSRQLVTNSSHLEPNFPPWLSLPWSPSKTSFTSTDLYNLLSFLSRFHWSPSSYPLGCLEHTRLWYHKITPNADKALGSQISPGVECWCFPGWGYKEHDSMYWEYKHFYYEKSLAIQSGQNKPCFAGR